MVGFFFVWRFCLALMVVSAYARCAKPTYADLRSDPHGANAKVIANVRGGGMRPGGAHHDHEVTDPGCSSDEKKATLRAAFVI